MIDLIDCKNCELLKQKEAEVAELKKEQDLFFLLLELGLITVEQWAKDKGLLAYAEKDVDQSLTQRNDQVSMLLETIGESCQTAPINLIARILKLL